MEEAPLCELVEADSDAKCGGGPFLFPTACTSADIRDARHTFEESEWGSGRSRNPHQLHGRSLFYAIGSGPMIQFADAIIEQAASFEEHSRGDRRQGIIRTGSTSYFMHPQLRRNGNDHQEAPELGPAVLAGRVGANCA
jgi:hypothetical protein